MVYKKTYRLVWHLDAELSMGKCVDIISRPAGAHKRSLNMRKSFVLLFLIPCFCFLGSAAVANALPAFPGAEGFGSTTPGGRGGRVIEVTNLNDAGAGSFREACLASGPRIVVFRVGGRIQLQSDVEFHNPFITIAGQTAPGGGICISGAPLRVYTHDVIIRGLRLRLGDSSQRDGLVIGSSADPEIAYNIIVDHCSVSWSLDENISTWRPCHDITFQWCISSEALLHDEGGTMESYGVLIGDNATNVSVHHCLIAHNKDRSPIMGSNSRSEVINNLVYNWRWWGTSTKPNARVNVIGNYYKTGPNWTGGKGVGLQYSDGVTLFVKGNIGPGREADTGDDWLVVNGSDTNRSLTAVISLSGIRTNNAADVYELVLNNAGATFPAIDAVDQRIIKSVRDGTGKHIASQNEVGGWPIYNPGQPSTDTDHDGMPDAWELAHGLDPNNLADANADRDGDGYTNIEEYINSLITMPGVALPAPSNVRIVQ
jgi:pectate lyase